ncbi:hypothetical protein H4R33_006317, partial [Dimargaris cristalligena]
DSSSETVYYDALDISAFPEGVSAINIQHLDDIRSSDEEINHSPMTTTPSESQVRFPTILRKPSSKDSMETTGSQIISQMPTPPNHKDSPYLQQVPDHCPMHLSPSATLGSSTNLNTEENSDTPVIPMAGNELIETYYNDHGPNENPRLNSTLGDRRTHTQHFEKKFGGLRAWCIQYSRVE